MIVYKITNKLNGNIYIGQTIGSLEVRWASHCRDKKHRLNNAIKKYGKNNFSIEEIGRYSNINDLNNAEEYFIDYHNSLHPYGYNLKAGGKNKKYSIESKLRMSKSAKKAWKEGRQKPHKMSEAAKKKLSIYFCGRKNPKISIAQLGRKNGPHSEETKRKIGKSQIRSKNHAYGKKLSKEHKRKIGLKSKGNQYRLGLPSYMKGKKHSAETIEKIRSASKKQWASKENREKMSNIISGKKYYIHPIAKTRVYYSMVSTICND
jgi:hypothetical protein